MNSNDDFWSYAEQAYPDRSTTLDYLAPLAKLFTPNSTIVDLGCGRGEFLEVLAAEGHTPIGVDTSRQCQAIANDHDWDFIHQTVFDFLENSSVAYQGLFSYGLLEHLKISDIKKLFGLMQKTCPNNTEVLFATHNPESIQSHTGPLYNALDHERLYSPDVLKYLFNSHGFTIKSIKPIPQKNTLLPSGVLTPGDTQKNITSITAVYEKIQESIPDTRAEIKKMIHLLWTHSNFFLEKIIVLENILQQIELLINRPLDYYILAVKTCE